MKKRTGFTIALLISFLLHALWVWLFLVAWGRMEPQPIEAFLDEEGMRIVDLTEPPNRIRPTKAKAVGVENNATTQETVASRQSPVAGKSAANRRPAINEQHNVVNQRPVTSDQPPQSALREPTSVRPKLPATALSEQLGSGLAAYVPEDYFPDYRHGGHTYLNVMRQPGVDYFVQLKRAFKMAWDPVPPLRAHFAANEVSRGSVKVVLGVSVDRQGNLGELFILKGSGLGRYDAEAIRTIRASSPFTSPPAPLVAADGTLRMSWTFIVYL